jgi:hypothetical protein
VVVMQVDIANSGPNGEADAEHAIYFRKVAFAPSLGRRFKRLRYFKHRDESVKNPVNT